MLLAREEREGIVTRQHQLEHRADRVVVEHGAGAVFVHATLDERVGQLGPVLGRGGDVVPQLAGGEPGADEHLLQGRTHRRQRQGDLALRATRSRPGWRR